ncbi:TIGR02147 family protein [Bdellovibrio bacteriovorus]|uniref:TIGR02147 family protein n=1 Tax=Bdellovibrio TaxID=958 RepID=UPI0035A9ADDD
MNVHAKEFPASMKELLHQELGRRCKTNPRYSLRAFARALNINPSHLSKILNGQISISEEKFEHFAGVLSLPQQTVEYLRRKETLIREISARDEWMKRVEKQVDLLNLSLDQFHVMSDWYHYAILELTRTKDFKPNVTWIQQQLEISEEQTEAAIERLFRLNLLIKNEQGQWIDNSEHATNGTPEFTAQALRHLQKQILQLAVNALETVPVEERLQSSMTMAVSRDQIAKAKQNIVTFQRAFATLLQEESSSKDAVYQLSVSFFPLTKNNEEAK